MVTVTSLICTVIFLATVQCTTFEPLDQLNTLRMVHVLFRHGDRAPIRIYPNDPHKNITSEIWPEGLGQLTKIGKAMTYQLGLWLRNRYDGFIKRRFDTKEIQVISTDYDRTLMSAECVMAAFYRPDDDDDEFREGFQWLPTPIHTAPKRYDKLLNIDESCPRVAIEYPKVRNIPKIKEFNKRNKELYEYLSEHSGYNVTNEVDVLILFDNLRIEKWYNLTIPNWALKKYQEMNTITNFFYEMYSYTLELKRLRGGPLLKTMTENMRNKSLGNLSERKMHVYSGHDTTVSAFLNSMGVYSGIAPPYSATVMVELHQIESDHFVKIFYQNDSDFANPPHEVTLPGCTFICPLSKWIDLLKHVIPEDLEKECNSKEPLQNRSDTFYSTESSEEGELYIQTTILQQIDSENVTSHHINNEKKHSNMNE